MRIPVLSEHGERVDDRSRAAGHPQRRHHQHELPPVQARRGGGELLERDPVEQVRAE
jgi:hypothetical protein